MKERLKDWFRAYDEEHASDLNYYNKKQIALYFLNNIRIFQVIIFLTILSIVFGMLRKASNLPISVNTKFIMFWVLFAIFGILTLKLFFSIFKLLFTQSKTGSLSKFESDKGSDK